MEEHYVTYDQAIKLKEMGFDGNRLDHYIRQGYYKFPNGRITPIKHDGDGILVQSRKEDAEKIPAPRLDQAQAWLRDKKELHVFPRLENVNKPDYVCVITLMHKESIRITDDGKYFLTYEQALSAGIDKALELLGKEE